MKPIFFGCFGQPGHFQWTRSGNTIRHDWHALPPGFGVGDGIDGGFAPMLSRYEEAPQGQATLTVKNGWTCLAFWDRSGDKRPGSNSAFVIPGELDFDSALLTAKATFPMIFARFPFEVKEFKP